MREFCMYGSVWGWQVTAIPTAFGSFESLNVRRIIQACSERSWTGKA